MFTRLHLATLTLSLLAGACVADTSEPAAANSGSGGGCAILDDVTTITRDGAPTYSGAVRDYMPMPCAKPIETCGPWRATQLCQLSPTTFERHMWTLAGDAGDVTFERESNTDSLAIDLHLESL